MYTVAAGIQLLQQKFPGIEVRADCDRLLILNAESFDLPEVVRFAAKFEVPVFIGHALVAKEGQACGSMERARLRLARQTTS